MSIDVTELEQRINDELVRLGRLSKDEFEEMRDAKFRQVLLHHINGPNPAYKNLLIKHGIDTNDVSNLPHLWEIDRLPFVTRKFLEKARYDLTPAVPMDEILRIAPTTGSTGKPLWIPHTESDSLERYSGLVLRFLVLNEIPLDTRGYYVSHWNPGIEDNSASHELVLLLQKALGEERVIDAATATPPPNHYKRLMEDQSIRMMASSPNFFLGLLGMAKSKGLPLRQFDYLFSGGSWIDPEDKAEVIKEFGVIRYPEFYVSTEGHLMGGTIGDDPFYHLFTDKQHFEILSKRKKPVQKGYGIPIVTSLTSYAVPIIRYEQRDLVRIVGSSDVLPHSIIITDIERQNEAQIGDASFPYSVLERKLPKYLLANGIKINALQLYVERDNTKRDRPIFRIESALENNDENRQMVADLITRAFVDYEIFEMKHVLKHDNIAPVTVELYAPGALRQGKLKVPVYVRNKKNG